MGTSPVVGIIGVYPGVNIATSLYEALQDRGFHPVFLGPISQLPTLKMAGVIIIDPNDNGYEQLVTDGHLTGVTVNTNYIDSHFSVVHTEGAHIFGSGAGDVTAMIRGALRTGTLTVRGYPEDEICPVEQEVFADYLVDAFISHFSEGPKTYDLIPKEQPKMTKGAVARVIFRVLQRYIYDCEETGRELNTPALTLPESVTATNDSKDFPATHIVVGEGNKKQKVYTHSYDHLYEYVEDGFANGVRTTIHRLNVIGDIPPISKADRYALPPEMIQELTGETGLVDPNEYLLRREFARWA